MTATTITLVYRLAATNELQELYAIIPPATVGTNDEAVRTMQAYVDTFNRYFELYGRKVVLRAYDARGTSSPRTPDRAWLRPRQMHSPWRLASTVSRTCHWSTRVSSMWVRCRHAGWSRSVSTCRTRRGTADPDVASWQEAGHASSLVAVPDDPPVRDAEPGGADTETFDHNATPTALEAFADDDLPTGRAQSSASEPSVHGSDPRSDSLARRADEPIAALEVLGASKRYGGVAALTDVTLRVMPGEIVCVIGSNGAGKTTLFDVCSGFVVPDAGRVRLFGRDITTMSPARRASVGLGRVFQDSRLFPAMTVAEVLRTSLERVVPVRDALACALRLTAVSESKEYLET